MFPHLKHTSWCFNPFPNTSRPRLSGDFTPSKKSNHQSSGNHDPICSDRNYWNIHESASQFWWHLTSPYRSLLNSTLTRGENTNTTEFWKRMPQSLVVLKTMFVKSRPLRFRTMANDFEPIFETIVWRCISNMPNIFWVNELYLLRFNPYLPVFRHVSTFQLLNKIEKYFASSDPTLTHYSDIVSDISSGSIFSGKCVYIYIYIYTCIYII